MNSIKDITGLAISDIRGYITTRFGFPVFQIVYIDFADGSGVDVDGEHEVAYIYSYEDDETDVPEGLRETNLMRLSLEGSK